MPKHTIKQPIKKQTQVQKQQAHKQKPGPGTSKPKTAKLKAQPGVGLELKGIPQTHQIDNEVFRTRHLPAHIFAKLKTNFARRVTGYEIASTRPEKTRMINKLIGPYAVPYLINTARFYHIDYLAARVQSFMKYIVPDIGKPLGEVLNILQDNGIKIYFHGGLIRDFFTGAKSTDIDIIFDRDVAMIKRICDKESWPCGTVMYAQQYINFGQDKGISLEGSNLKSSLLTPMHLHEATINDFTWDLKYNILIDVTGHGLEDVMYRVIRISPLPNYWQRWADEDFKKPLRYFKLIQKGFRPINDATHKFVTDYITQNYDAVYETQFSAKYPVSRIKHFLIKNITQGEIDPETGVYTFGPLQNKLVPYLLVIKRNLGKAIFVKMLAHFTESDLSLLKDNKVVSSMRTYLRAKDVMRAHAATIEYLAESGEKQKKTPSAGVGMN
jgi:hypothetical protein